MLIETSVMDACQSNLSMVGCRFSQMCGFSEQATVRGRCRRCERQRLVSQRNEVQVLANWPTVTKNKKSAQAQNDEFE